MLKKNLVENMFHIVSSFNRSNVSMMAVTEFEIQ